MNAWQKFANVVEDMTTHWPDDMEVREQMLQRAFELFQKARAEKTR